MNVRRLQLELPALPGFYPREAFAPGDLGYVPKRARLRPNNRVLPLVGGREAFPAMLDAIRIARRHVHLETYILRDDGVGHDFQHALVERARAGVTVRLIYDGVGAFGLPARYVDELRAAGVEAHVYHPVAPWRARRGLNRRDHQKILVVDDEVAFCGGINIGDEYQPVEHGGGGWHDVHARVEGPAVADLARLFRRTWLVVGGTPFDEPRTPLPHRASALHTVRVEVISNTRLQTRSRMRHAYMHAIRRANESIYLMNAYFIPDRGLRRVFADATRRGVDVRVIVPSTSDVTAVYWASRHLYGRLLRDGVRIFEWPERMMHAKTGVIDGVWSTIGSYNLDKRSFVHNLEVGLVSIDRELGARMQEQFLRDLTICREVTLDEWRKRSRWNKMLEWCYYQLRYWL